MSVIKKELALLVWQFLREEGLHDTAHEFERETACYFDTKYFQELATHGKWEKAEEYLSGFCRVQDNRFSMEMFFGIRKQKYLEALDRKEFDKAIRILRTDLKMFENVNKEVFQELMSLLMLDNFRQNEKLSSYGDTSTARHVMAVELHRLIEQNPLLAPKLHLQQQTPAALKTLLVNASGYGPLPTNSLPGPVLLPISPHPSSLQNAAAAAAAAVAAAAGPQHVMLSDTSLYSELTGTRSAALPAAVPSAKRQLDVEPPMQPSLKKRNQEAPALSADDLPGTLVMYLTTSATCCSFHPSNPTLLAVGTLTGSVELWMLPQVERVRELRPHSMLVADGTQVTRISWSKDGLVFGVAFAESKMRGVIHLHNSSSTDVSESRIEVDAHRGTVTDLVCCVADGKHVAVSGGADGEIRVWLTDTGSCIWQTTAHSGPVTSVCPNIKGGVSYILSAGQDGRVRAWLYNSSSFRADYVAPGRYCTHLSYSADGSRLFSCGLSENSLVEWNESSGDLNWHYRGYHNVEGQHIRFAATASLLLACDGGKLKVWLMDRPQEMLAVLKDDLPPGASVCINEAGNVVAAVASSSKVAIFASKSGMQLLQPPAPSRAPVLANNGQVERERLHGQTERERLHGQAERERIHGQTERERLHGQTERATVHGQPEGQPTAEGWGSSYLANHEDDCDRRSETKGSGGAAVGAAVAAAVNEVDSASALVKRREEWRRPQVAALAPPTITDRNMVVIQDFPDEMDPSTVQALRFTGAGHALLALCKNGWQKMWQARSSSRSSGPSGDRLGQWQQVGVREMMNEVLPGHPIKGNFAISRNDSYALSTSGGKVSLYNLLGCKLLTTMQAPPPATTALGFHPRDNNVIALGLENGTVLLQNVRLDATLQSFRCHAARISDMMFASPTRLVTAGADAKLVIHAITEPKCDLHEVAKELRLEPSKGSYIQPAGGEDLSLCLHPSTDTLLCVHPAQLALYGVGSCQRLASWSPSSRTGLGSPIMAATYSSTGAHIYASFTDAAIAVFDSTSLEVVCRISPKVVDPLSKGNFATAIACHPSHDSPSCFVVALHNGVVQIWEPQGGPAADWQLLATQPPRRPNDVTGTPPPSHNANTSNKNSGTPFGSGQLAGGPSAAATNSSIQEALISLKKDSGSKAAAGAAANDLPTEEV